MGLAPQTQQALMMMQALAENRELAADVIETIAEIVANPPAAIMKRASP